MKRLLDIDRDTLVSLERFNTFFLDRKGLDVTVLDLRDVNSYMSFFVIVTGNSMTHCRGMARDLMKLTGTEGPDLAFKPSLDTPWVVLDYYHIVVHIFTEEARSYYQLEKLWGDARHISF